LTDSTIWGEFPASEDCPDEGDGGFCTQFAKGGVGSSTGKRGHAIPMHETGSSHLPSAFGGTADGVWALKVLIKNLHLKGFPAKTHQGEDMRAIFLNHAASDLIPIHEFENIVFEDVAPEGFIWFFPPPKKWAVASVCGNFPCTGPENTVFRFMGSTYIGDVTPGIDVADFSLIP